jgi:hypothetical protein
MGDVAMEDDKVKSEIETIKQLIKNLDTEQLKELKDFLHKIHID